MTSYTKPKTIISYSLDMEARRLLYLAARLPDGELQNRGFLVLPHLYPQVPTSQIVFPDLPYCSIPYFWEQCSRLTLTTPIDAPASLIDATQTLISPVYDTVKYEKHVSLLQKSWESIENKFWSNLFTLFPEYKYRIESANIYSTQFGPYTTFSLAGAKTSEITIFVRQDCGLDKVLWTLLTCLFRPKMQDNMKMTWEEIEATVDWLMTESSLSCGIKMTDPTIKNLRADQVARYRQLSDRYMRKFGFRLSSRLKKTAVGYVFGDTPISGLSDHDISILDILLSERGSTVTFEELAAVLWPGSDSWTLYAVVKAIERVRKKICASGINLPVIHTYRRVGYSIL